MSPILDYTGLFALLGEMQKLEGEKFLDFYLESKEKIWIRLSNNRNLFINLSPAKPLILSTVLTGPKAKNLKTPVLNFLKAHFKNATIKSFEIAAKPNRTWRLLFENPELRMEMSCFPHGQRLSLTSGKTHVSQPPGKPEAAEFIDPEKVTGWETHERIGNLTFTEGIQKAPAVDPRRMKLEKVLQKLETQSSSEDQKDLDEIKTLMQTAEDIKISSRKSKGGELTRIFEKIRKLKTKSHTRNSRILEIKDQLTNLPDLPPPPSIKKSEKTSPFLKVPLSSGYELWIGRSAIENDELVRQGSPHELWMHLRDYPGAHGLIRSGKKSSPSEVDLEMAMQIVAKLSQTKKRNFSYGEKLEFILAPLKFVRKPKGAKPGSVIVEREQVRRIAFRPVIFFPKTSNQS